MKRCTVLAALLCTAFSVSARPQRALVDVTVTDLDENHALSTYRDRGQTYVAGEPGHRYAVTVRNNTGQRVLAVVSVDGVNAVTGETAAAQQSGYVLEPYESAEVRGWRKSLSDVAEFYFTALPDSYAARTGRPANVGVIGVAVFEEKLRRPPPPQISLRERDAEAKRSGEYAGSANESASAAQPSQAPLADAARAPAEPEAPAPASAVGATAKAQTRARQELGTGHGERVYDPVGTTAFERATRSPAQVVSIFYDSYDVLVERGIAPPPYRHRREPDPFPIGFVPDPN